MPAISLTSPKSAIMPNLLPYPQRLTATTGHYRVPAEALIALDVPEPQQLRLAAALVQAAVREHCAGRWEVVAGRGSPPEQVALILRLAANPSLPPQGYTLTVAPAGITVEAAEAAGLFYGALTLAQLLRAGPGLEAVHIEDWPDYPARGVMLDISRDKVPTLATLLALVDRLASWKINQLQLYTEHTFAYRRHPEVWAAASPMTGEDILALDAYCRERFIELVPNQNSFGHLTRWLRHPRYAPLAETHAPFDTPWGMALPGPYSLCPTDPGSLELVRGWYDELLPHFTSRQFNVGCDETVDVGQGRSRAECQARGAGRVYLDFVLKLYREVTARGRVMQFWGDVILGHPELVPELPRDAIALEWGYEAEHPFDTHGAQFRAAGLPFYVCPGTSAWNSIAGRTANALDNLRNAAASGRQHGASGYLITDWGDNGHWQPLSVSDLGLAAGAAYAWAWDANRALDIAPAVSVHAFADPAGSLGRAAYDLGNVYQATGLNLHNSSPLFWALQWPLDQVRGYRDTLSPETLAQTLEAVDAALAPLGTAQSQRADAALVRAEFELAGRLMRHAVRRLQFAAGYGRWTKAALSADLRGLISDYRAQWLTRNRPGGLADSVARFDIALADYA